ncbi:insulin-like growth factor-binding protein 2 [Ischnura elegans]|uniref:insulin-like growth factor-binding protein 2 n=1 Tax=Ischnura elegans TaxID=197161 RepID=UPI001ED8B0F6|nr:insulin-like growth factor-binding protein 2 [Ischnura elegans]
MALRWALFLLSVATASPPPVPSLPALTSTDAASTDNDAAASGTPTVASEFSQSLQSTRAVTRGRAVSCVCTVSECERVSAWECPGGPGALVWDACRCCRVCARVEDEPCGGFHGACAPGLRCLLEPGLLPSKAAPDARGTCKRVVPEEEGSPPTPSTTAGLWPLRRTSTAMHRRWPPKRRSRSTVGPGVEKRYTNQP